MQWLKWLIREIRGNALWDAVKFLFILGGSLILPALVGILQRLRGTPLDIVLLGALFICSLVLLSVAYTVAVRRERPNNLSSDKFQDPQPILFFEQKQQLDPDDIVVEFKDVPNLLLNFENHIYSLSVNISIRNYSTSEIRISSGECNTMISSSRFIDIEKNRPL